MWGTGAGRWVAAPPSPVGNELTLTTATVKKMVEAWEVGPAGGQLPHVTWDGSSL